MPSLLERRNTAGVKRWKQRMKGNDSTATMSMPKSKIEIKRTIYKTNINCEISEDVANEAIRLVQLLQPLGLAKEVATPDKLKKCIDLSAVSLYVSTVLYGHFEDAGEYSISSALLKRLVEQLNVIDCCLDLSHNLLHGTRGFDQDINAAIKFRIIYRMQLNPSAYHRIDSKQLIESLAGDYFNFDGDRYLDVLIEACDSCQRPLDDCFTWALPTETSEKDEKLMRELTHPTKFALRYKRFEPIVETLRSIKRTIIESKAMPLDLMKMVGAYLPFFNDV